MSLNPSELPIRLKVPACVVGSVLAVAIAAGAISVYVSAATLGEEVGAKLSSMADEKAVAMSRYLASLDQDIKTVASNSQTLDALQAFDAAWREMGTNQQARLQQSYIEDNPHPLGEKEKLDAASNGSSYDKAHERFHPWFREFLYQRGYYDIFLIGRDGDLIYSVFKEPDYATNLLTGEFRDSDLGEAFRASQLAEPSQTSFFDFAPYAPSHDAPAAFLSTPIFDRSGALAGSLVFQMPIDQLNDVAGNARGLGNTGDSFLVGTDFLLRTDATQTDQNDILKTKFENAATQAGLSGQRGSLELDTADGARIIGYAPIEFHGAQYVMVATQSTQEALAAVDSMVRQIALAALAMIVVFGGIGLLVARSITRPMNAVVSDMNAIAGGQLEQTITGLERKDEIGEMAKALDVFKTNALDRLELEEQQRVRVARIEELIAVFDRESGNSLSGFARASGALETIAEDVSAAVGKSNASIQTVAAAAEELATSIQEISRSTASSQEVASRSVEQVEDASKVVSDLVGDLQQIVGIIDLISDIAEQTNLLALNATIESARAGEAGKGFAVVASEVKALASRTSQATSDIAGKINAIQTGAQQATSSMGKIRDIVSRIDEFTLTVASAIEQQHAATGEIAENAQGAVNQAEIVRRRIAGGESAQSSSGDDSVHSATSELNMAAANLRSGIELFLQGVRAA